MGKFSIPTFITLWFLLVIFCATPLMATAAEFETQAKKTIYLVRHAEKQIDVGDDPSLTDVGKDRALNLVGVLGSKNISAIYSTNYQRTMETAKPLSTALGIQIKFYDPDALESFAEQLQGTSGNALVVGHSNTTPMLSWLLGGEAYGDIEESEYDRLYQLDLSNDGVITQLHRTDPVQKPNLLDKM